MYLNLVLIDQIRTGKLESSSEFSEILKKLELDYGIVALMAIDGDAKEPLAEIPVFSGWRNLGPMDQFERSNLILKASGMLGARDRLSVEINDLMNSSLAIDELVDAIVRLRRMKAQSRGTRIEFLGARDASFAPMAKSWSASSTRPPIKKEVLASVEFFLKKTSPNERPEWNRIVAEFKSWLSDVPTEGLEIDEKKVWEWPELVDDEAGGEGPPLKLRLTMTETTALRDEVTQEFRDEQDRNRKLLIKHMMEQQRLSESDKKSDD